jgi:hypothetical protein
MAFGFATSGTVQAAGSARWLWLAFAVEQVV